MYRKTLHKVPKYPLKANCVYIYIPGRMPFEPRSVHEETILSGWTDRTDCHAAFGDVSHLGIVWAI